jgi:DNA-binding GntR family transcriptional regulator
VAKIKKIERESLSESVYRMIREALVDGEFAPGETLRIVRLAERFGTSGTPVREAIFRLVSDQALEMTKSTAVKVAMIEPNELREILDIRSLLEGAAAARAATRITERQLSELNRIHDGFMKVSPTDAKSAALKNRNFHFYLLELGDCPITYGIVENLWVRMGPLLRLFHENMPATESGDQHKHFAVLEALGKGDAEGAEAALRADIKQSNNLFEWLSSQHDDQIKPAATQG